MLTYKNRTALVLALFFFAFAIGGCGESPEQPKPNAGPVQPVSDPIPDTTPIALNHAPTFTALDPIRAVTGILTRTKLTLADADGDAMTLEVTAQATHGTITVEGLDVLYKSTAGYKGQDTGEVTIADPGGARTAVPLSFIVDSVRKGGGRYVP
jgi:hypothetical protein